MNFKQLLFVGFLLTILTTQSAQAQEGELVPKDLPAVPEQNESSMEFLGDEMLELIDEAEVIEAYHFAMTDRNETLPDSNGLLGFKVMKKVDKLQSRDIRTLKNLVGNKESYYKGETLPKCGFDPDLAFRLVSGESSFSMLMMILPTCNVVKFFAGDQVVFTKDFCPSRGDFIQLATEIFPREYLGIQEDVSNCLEVVEEPIAESTTNEEGSQAETQGESSENEDSNQNRRRDRTNTYKVKKGDNWKKIAKANNLTKEELKALNPTKDKLKPGIRLKIKMEEDEDTGTSTSSSEEDENFK